MTQNTYPARDALQDLLKRVRRIEIRSRHLSKKLFSGEYHSAFKGKGMSFVDVRPYQYGDDVRFIDWNVTARYKEAYVKTYEEERELTVILLLDLSGSGAFGTRKMTKRELLTELSAVLAISANSNNDKVGAVFFTDKIEKFIPPRKGRSHILRIIRELLDFEPQNQGTSISTGLNFITRIIKKKAIVFLISDFNDTSYSQDLAIAARKHDLAGIHLYDPAEAELPNAGLILVKNPENDHARWLDTSSEKERVLHKASFNKRMDFFKAQFRKNGADSMSIQTDKPYLPVLHAFLKSREARKFSHQTSVNNNELIRG
jgi:uncharacterized protein (DUF58 family)